MVETYIFKIEFKNKIGVFSNIITHFSLLSSNITLSVDLTENNDPLKPVTNDSNLDIFGRGKNVFLFFVLKKK